MTLRWPDMVLPTPQVESVNVDGAGLTQLIDVLAGPTRARLVNRNATGTYQFEVWLTALQAEYFEGWYNQVVASHNGEWSAPWIGAGHVLAFVDEYELRPLGLGWSLTGMVIETRHSQALCDGFINDMFGSIYRDDGASPDIYLGDLAAVDIYADDYDLDYIAEHPC